MRESHEVRAGSDKRDALAYNFLRVVIDHVLATGGAKAEGFELLGVRVDILIPMHRSAMNADLCTARKVLPGRQSNSVLGDHLLHHAATDKAPHPHAFADDAVQRHHAGERVLCPFSSGRFQFSQNLGANVSKIRRDILSRSEIQNEVGKCDGGGLDDCELDHREAFVNYVHGTEGRVVAGEGVID